MMRVRKQIHWDGLHGTEGWDVSVPTVAPTEGQTVLDQGLGGVAGDVHQALDAAAVADRLQTVRVQA